MVQARSLDDTKKDKLMPRKSLSGFLTRSPYVATYVQEGENTAYVAIANGAIVAVDAAQAKALQWVYTPPFDVWVEVQMFAGLLQKMDAAYHYAQLQLLCTPAPAFGNASAWDAHMCHSQVQLYDRHNTTKIWGLTGGVAYTMNGRWTLSGGTWQLYQSPAHLYLQGKAWPR